jgi:hypothetical protein
MRQVPSVFEIAISNGGGGGGGGEAREMAVQFCGKMWKYYK